MKATLYYKSLTCQNNTKFRGLKAQNNKFLLRYFSLVEEEEGVDLVLIVFLKKTS